MEPSVPEACQGRGGSRGLNCCRLEDSCRALLIGVIFASGRQVALYLAASLVATDLATSTTVTVSAWFRTSSIVSGSYCPGRSPQLRYRPRCRCWLRRAGLRRGGGSFCCPVGVTGISVNYATWRTTATDRLAHFCTRTGTFGLFPRRQTSADDACPPLAHRRRSKDFTSCLNMESPKCCQTSRSIPH